MLMFNWCIALAWLVSFGCGLDEKLPVSQNDTYYNEFVENLQGIQEEFVEKMQDVQEEFNATVMLRTRALIRSNMADTNQRNLKRFDKFAAASYCFDFTLKNWVCLHCLSLGRKIEVTKIYYDDSTGSRAYIALDHEQKTINVVFRGSSNLKNWIQNFKLVMVEYKNVADAKVHKGFLQCVHSLKDKIIPDLKEQINNQTSYKINVVGHSLGGAIAAISILEFRRELNIPDSQLQLVTYGEPRIGNLQFANYFTDQLFSMFRVVHNHDLIPHVPASVLNFHHRRRMIFIGSNSLYNCHPNNWSDNTCTVAQKVGMSILDHLTYFNTIFGPAC